MTSSADNVLVVTAHPDDVDFGSAGTVATWTAAGVEVKYCIITDGAAGSADPDVDSTQLAEQIVQPSGKQRTASVDPNDG